MRLTDVAAGVPVFLLWIACTPPVDRATTNDGDTCTEGGACDSRICEVDGVCRGSNCEKDDGCREGWTCLRKSGFLGTTGTCVPGCDQCPVGRACQNGGTECLTIQVTVDVTIVEPAERNVAVAVNTTVKLRADVKVTGGKGDNKVSWVVHHLGTNDAPVNLEGIETTHTFTQVGQYQVDANVIASGAASDQDSIGVNVQ